MNDPLNGELVSTSQVHKHPLMRLVIVLGILASIVSAYFIAMDLPVMRVVLRPVRALVTNLHTPPELKSASFVRVDQYSTVQYVPSNGAYVAHNQQGALVSEDVRAKQTARVLKTPNGQYQVMVGDQIATSSSATKVGVSLSPDSHAVAFAETMTPSLGMETPTDFLSQMTMSPSNWSVVLLDTATASSTRISNGVSPVFVDDTHIVFLREDGIYMFDTTTHVLTRVVERSMKKVSLVPLVSPDRTLIAVRDSSMKTIAIFRIDVGKQQVRLVTDISTSGGVASYALGNTGLYSVRLIDQRTEVWMTDFESHTYTAALILPDTVRGTRVQLGIL